MLFELENGVLVNIIQITTIEKMDTSHSVMLKNGTEVIYEYEIHMADESVWYATKKDVEQLKEQNNE